MGMNDLPQIDDSSENDDEAKSYLSLLFSQKAGFITREQIPDKGCDYLVEIIEEKLATNRSFGVQLKSIQHPSVIEDGQTISYTWKTARLNYLKQTAPIYGLLVLYDVSVKNKVDSMSHNLAAMGKPKVSIFLNTFIGARAYFIKKGPSSLLVKVSRMTTDMLIVFHQIPGKNNILGLK